VSAVRNAKGDFHENFGNVCVLTLACAMPAWADVGINEVNSDYELRGTTTKEIHENILKNAPREEGNIVDAETK
jgi:hypothetical protein